ncbi:uncharacterized protein BCR38DRAFT_215572 [Pseudomassariella vexata]|uniref:Uncharacterized protein n=1 Tax=Pseudomassariella vexata TaxID=1141098 RepID=A0A1Y2DYU2_9PEZI|nr:uncharacterized protein BCR38DRAFT_215572 [Pseudomassariella vexata]ORY64462.1 hypothetical protein BCR38DRAFT_215572 [Pseudomassariella vexata]
MRTKRMEASVKSIESLVSALPGRPHHLSISATSQYQQRPRDQRLEEEAYPRLEYMTFLHDVDRGVLLTRAYFDIRKDPDETTSNAPSPPKPRSDPNKPVTKLSLKDYKNRKKETTPPAECNSPIKGGAPQANLPVTKAGREKPAAASKKQAEPAALVAKEMERRPEPKKPNPNLPPKPEVRRPRSPSLDKRKRPIDARDDRPQIRSSNESLAPVASNARLPAKPEITHTVERQASHEKKLSKDLKSSAALTNGRSVLSNSFNHGASPRLASQVNGSLQKALSSHHNTSRKEKAENMMPKLGGPVPPLLSPLHLSNLDQSDELKSSRSTPTKRPTEKDGAQTKQPLKRPRDETDASPAPKKLKPNSKIPPLLSPTLPPLVMEELAKSRKLTPPKDSSQKSSVASNSPGSAKKTVPKPVKEDTIYVDSTNTDKKEDSPSLIVVMKYKRSVGKTVARLLALAPKKKPETVKKDASEVLKKEDRVGRERSDSANSVGYKRPRASTDVVEPPMATKRPRTSDNPPPPSTPSKQATAMQRVASSSSQAGTPGAGNSLTPAAPTSSDRRLTSVDPEKMMRLKKRHHDFMNLGIKLKHDRDAILKTKDGKPPPNLSSRDRNVAMAAAIQCALAYMLSFKAMDDARDVERKQRDPNSWKGLLPLLRVYRLDLQSSNPLSALLLRLHGVCLVSYGRALVTIGPENASAARDLFQLYKDQDQTWRLADNARRTLDGNSGSDDSGLVAKLINRIGPWTSPEEAVPVSLDILRKVIREVKFTAVRQLSELSESMANGSRS